MMACPLLVLEQYRSWIYESTSNTSPVQSQHKAVHTDTYVDKYL